MEVLTLLIAIVALVVGVAAFMRTGGVEELRRQVQSLSSTSETVRDRTADAIDRLEQLIRGRDRQKPGEPGSSTPGTG
jgi:hypothetical protein